MSGLICWPDFLIGILIGWGSVMLFKMIKLWIEEMIETKLKEKK